MVYKIVTDIEQVDINKLYKYASREDFEFCLEGDNIYIYSLYDTQTSISMIMKKIGVANFFIKKITEKPTNKNNMDFINSWIYTKIERDELREFEAKKQQELRQMLDNIEAVRQELHEILQNKIGG